MVSGGRATTRAAGNEGKQCRSRSTEHYDEAYRNSISVMRGSCMMRDKVRTGDIFRNGDC